MNIVSRETLFKTFNLIVSRETKKGATE